MRIQQRRHAAIKVSTVIVLGYLVLGDCQAGDISYDYDALNRLTKVTYADGSTVEYEYDLAGNITRSIKTPVPKTGKKVDVTSSVAPAEGIDDDISRDVDTDQAGGQAQSSEGSGSNEKG